MNKSHAKTFAVIEGGRKELERRLITTFFTPYQPNNMTDGERIAEQIKPRLTPASVKKSAKVIEPS
jgi:hypothetical protein